MRRERFSRRRLQSKPLISDPGVHHGTCLMHVPWCMSGSLTRGGGENLPGIPGACAIRNFAYLVRGPWRIQYLLQLWLPPPSYNISHKICPLFGYALTCFFFFVSRSLFELNAHILQRCVNVTGAKIGMSWEPFTTSIDWWISNNMHRKLWSEIICPFSVATVQKKFEYG